MFYTNYIYDDVLRLRDVFDSFFENVPQYNVSAREFPYVNLYEYADRVEIKAILTGVKREDLNIELIDSTIVLEGERKSDHKEVSYIRNERDFGKFRKSIEIPFPVDRDSIHADLKHGILTVTLNKSEEAKPKKIEIKA